ncbi:hypothetical protein CMUS01_13909 [Colletotrichum musicola]|uniref:Uncharacterized protein n=2 Tax=Colletotrichum orchidearum species complex TaxID=2707337 RepID=A0A8H6J984_9PEZI|nr:hypothetical protein CMUS01_13909 [Colletotrichum musicola]KAF6836279.1 hypothetical protein CPLU01_03777 [Colletotrichum plurivorum]
MYVGLKVRLIDGEDQISDERGSPRTGGKPKDAGTRGLQGSDGPKSAQSLISERPSSTGHMVSPRGLREDFPPSRWGRGSQAYLTVEGYD